MIASRKIPFLCAGVLLTTFSIARSESPIDPCATAANATPAIGQNGTSQVQVNPCSAPSARAGKAIARYHPLIEPTASQSLAKVAYSGSMSPEFLNRLFNGQTERPNLAVPGGPATGPVFQRPKAWQAQKPAGPDALANLAPGQDFAGFAARTLYTDTSGRPVGARFIEPKSGMPVDLLFTDSVAQASFYANAPPPDESGLPHTFEHLIYKGARGKYFQSLLAMNMASATALTLRGKTDYQVYSAAGPEGFRQVMDAYLRTVLTPDFSDQEIRDEVAKMVVETGPGNVLRLSEGGTVYNEMATTVGKPGHITLFQLLNMVLGPGHPLARNVGGEPLAIRNITPKNVRDFHAHNYHLSNMEIAVAIPRSWSAEEFLRGLGSTLNKLASRPKAGLPPVPEAASLSEFHPDESTDIKIGSFPSSDPNVPQRAAFGWKPIANYTADDAVRIDVLLKLFAEGETSYLHHDLVAQGDRKVDAGITAVTWEINELPAPFVFLVINLPGSAVTPENLQNIRSVIVQRIQWIAGLEPGTPDFQAFTQKARAAIRASRIEMLKLASDPPGFGRYRNGVELNDILDLLNKENGFKQSLALSQIYDKLDAEVASGANPWKEILGRAHLLEIPYGSAVKPDPDLLKRQNEDRDTRIADYGKMLMDRYKTSDLQAALQRFKAEADSADAEIAARDAAIPKPSFTKDPPLDLDPVVTLRKRLRSGPTSVRALFESTPFTQINVYFNLKKGLASRESISLLPVLASALGDLGVTTGKGEKLDYVKARERSSLETGGLGTHYSSNPLTDRYELSITASASDPKEIDNTAAWLESYLLRHSLGPESRGRLIDILRDSIQDHRSTFQIQSYYWTPVAADVYRFQDKPAYMALYSAFTSLYYLDRLRWKLEDPDPATQASYLKLFASLESLSPSATQTDAQNLLKSAKGDMADFLRFEISHLPPDNWRSDLKRILRETRQDLATPSSVTIRRLNVVLKDTLTRSGARVEISGNSENTKHAEEALDEVLAKLPKEGPPSRDLGHDPAVARQIQSRTEPRHNSNDSAKKRPANVALIDDSQKAGTFIFSGSGVDYHQRDPNGLADYLAQETFSGTATHSFYLRNFAAGNAYSSWIHSYPSRDMARLYADTCPNPVSTLKFMADTVRNTSVSDPFYIPYSLANTFGDYAVGTDNYAGRGEQAAARLVDGITPDVIRDFKTRLIRAAGSLEPDHLQDHVRSQVGKLLPGLGKPGSVSRSGTTGLFVGPRSLADPFSDFLKSQGEPPLVLIYPRDFWPPEKKRAR